VPEQTSGPTKRSLCPDDELLVALFPAGSTAAGLAAGQLVGRCGIGRQGRIDRGNHHLGARHFAGGRLMGTALAGVRQSDKRDDDDVACRTSRIGPAFRNPSLMSSSPERNVARHRLADEGRELRFNDTGTALRVSLGTTTCRATTATKRQAPRSPPPPCPPINPDHGRGRPPGRLYLSFPRSESVSHQPQRVCASTLAPIRRFRRQAA